MQVCVMVCLLIGSAISLPICPLHYSEAFSRHRTLAIIPCTYVAAEHVSVFLPHTTRLCVLWWPTQGCQTYRDNQYVQYGDSDR